MARTSAHKRSARPKSSASRAEAILQDTQKSATRLALRVLEGGKPSTVRRGRKSRRNSTPVIRASAQVAPAGLQADVTPQLAEAAPAFGDVLRSFAHSIALAQTAMDDAALESVKTLSAQKVDIPVLIKQKLTEDGTPDSVEIQTASVPLTSIVMPSMQEVQQGTIRMDMRVQSFNSTSGVNFNQNMASAGVSYSGHGFGFAVAMNNTNVNAQFSNMSDFSSGSVMMSVDIVDRTGFELPVPAQYGIGAAIMVRLASVTQSTTTVGNTPTTTRTATVTVKKVTTTGAVTDLPAAEMDASVPPGVQFTKSDGQLVMTLDVAGPAAPYVERKAVISFGQLTKDVVFYM
jgi:hypothetical protein